MNKRAFIGTAAVAVLLSPVVFAQAAFRNSSAKPIVVFALRCNDVENGKLTNVLRAPIDLVSPRLYQGQTEEIGGFENCQTDFVLYWDGSFEGPDRSGTKRLLLDRLDARARAGEDYLAARERGSVDQLAIQGGHNAPDRDYSMFVRELCRMHAMGRLSEVETLAHKYIDQRRPKLFENLKPSAQPESQNPLTTTPACTWCKLGSFQCWQNFNESLGMPAITPDYCEVDGMVENYGNGAGTSVVSKQSVLCSDPTKLYPLQTLTAQRGMVSFNCPSTVEGWTDFYGGGDGKTVPWISANDELVSTSCGQTVADAWRTSTCPGGVPANVQFDGVCAYGKGSFRTW